MKRSMIPLLLLFFLLFGCKNIYSQVYGKLYKAEEANILFGPVLSSVKVSTEMVKSMMKETKNTLLFRVSSSKVEFVNNERVSIMDKTLVYDKSVVFKVVSLTVLEDLFNKENKSETWFEIRKNVVSITNGTCTVENMIECPPYCWE